MAAGLGVGPAVNATRIEANAMKPVLWPLFILACLTAIASVVFAQRTTTSAPQSQNPTSATLPAYLAPCAEDAAFEAWTQPGIVDPVLFTAKTAAVLADTPEVRGGGAGFLRDLLAGGHLSPSSKTAKDSAEAGIKNGGRYKLTDDPATADLLVYTFMWKKWSDTWSQLTIVKRDGQNPCEPQVLYGRRSSVEWPAMLFYDLEKDAQKAEAAKPRAGEIWPKQVQEANKKLEKGKFEDAAREARKAINTAELGFGSKDDRVLASLKLLIGIYEKAGWSNCCDALAVYRRTIKMLEDTIGPEDSGLIPYLETYAKILRGYGREEEADVAQARAASIRAKRQ